MRTWTGLLMLLTLSLSAFAAGLSGISNQEASSGLKQALLQGSSAAVAKLGVPNGFLGNPKVRIPLPASLEKARKLMRMFGMGKQADELVVTMNRAAEAAVPEAKPLLIDAIKRMSVRDAKGILTGGNDSVTQYFARSTSAALTAKFLPIVKRATDKVGLAQQYNAYVGKGARFGLVKEKDANIESYVTQKTLDGLFLMIGEEERAIRSNPLGQASGLLKKVFGAL